MTTSVFFCIDDRSLVATSSNSIPSKSSTWLNLVASFVLLTNFASAATFGLFTYTDNGSSVTITDYPESAIGAVDIPATIDGKPVTSIGIGAFQACGGLTSILIPNSVTLINDNAFHGCQSLASIIIPNSVTSIGHEAFFFCIGLESVTIPNSVTSIGNNAFNTTSLFSVMIGNGVTSIGNQAFGNTRLQSVTIPGSVTSIGFNCFGGSFMLYSITFKGDLPSIDSAILGGTDVRFVYYYLGTTGWEETFEGRPTVALGIPTFSTQPANVTVLQGTRATFTVLASGATDYQWQKNEVDIPLATSATLTLNKVNLTDAANYRVIISNQVGNVASDPSTLTVIPDTDLDGLSDTQEASLGTNPNNSDSDEDGLNDRAEIQVHLSNPLLKDSDGDGFEDGFEVSTGFNPAQTSSSPDSESTIGNAVGFRFNAGLGFSYRIEDSTDLQNWNTLETPIIGAGGMVTRFYFTEGQPKRYFRVRKN